MGRLSNILRNGDGGRLIWWCPGCNRHHEVIASIREDIARPDPVEPDWTPPAEYYQARDGAWSWNGRSERPSLMPSVLCTYEGADAGQDGAPPKVCHCFVVDGNMQFLGDCTHALAGQVVPIPPWPHADGEWGGV